MMGNNEPRQTDLQEMEYVNCALCGLNDTTLLFKKKDLIYLVTDYEFHVVKCRCCGLVYVNPRPTEEEIQRYYPPEFYDVKVDRAELLRQKSGQLEAKYAKIKLLTAGRLLDVGCMKGEFLYFMKQKGWQVKGVEFSSHPPNLYDLDIFFGELAEAGYAECSFDLVTLWAVLEHVYDPKGMLQEINRILSPGGRVVLLVTNINSIPGRLMRHDDVPRHTTMFSKRTISQMLEKAGFRVERFHFGNDIFNGSTRGFLNYIVKLVGGEPIDKIVARNCTPGRWHEFSSQLNGVPSSWMLRVDSLDIAATPYLDRLLNAMHFGFIITVEASKVR